MTHHTPTHHLHRSSARRRRSSLAVTGGALLLLGSTAAYAGIPTLYTWNFGADGLWSNAANWDLGLVPNGSDHAVRIDDSATNVTVSLNQNATIDSLTVDAGDELLVTNPFDLLVGGDISNAGLISIDGLTSTTKIQITDNLNVSGGGVIDLIGVPSTNFIDSQVTALRMTNIDNTIQGAGNIGSNLMSLTNQATIDANITASDLRLDPPTSGDFTNSGVYRASNGGRMLLQSGTYDNTGGLMEALDASEISLSGTLTITGGELSTAGTGVISCSANTMTLVDVISSGNLVIRNTVDPRIAGAFTNSGTVIWEGSTSQTALTIDGDVTLDGGGTLDMSGGATVDVISATATLDRLTNVDNVIQGSGLVGNNTMNLTNQNLVHANVNGELMTLDPPTSGEFFNSGTFRASNGGILQLTAGDFDNTSGLIEALDGSEVRLFSTVNITNGEIASSGSGFIAFTGNTVTLTDVLNSGSMIIRNSVDPRIAGTFENTGSVTWEGATTQTALTISGDTTLIGGGTLHMAGGDTTDVITAVASLNRLTNVDNTIHGSGNIGNNTMSLTNQIDIVADIDGENLSLDPPTNGNFINTGTIRATNGGILDFRAGTYENLGGLIEIEDNSEARFTTSLTINDGEITTSGSGFVAFTGNTVRLNNVTNSGAMVIRNAIDPWIEGTFTNSGSITFEGATSLTQLTVNGDVTLDGGGTISMAGGGTTDAIGAATTLDRLTNVDNTIHGTGIIGNNTMSFTNQGLVEADDAADTLRFDPPTNGDFINQGTLLASGDAGIAIVSGPMDNQGTVTINGNSQLVRTGAYTQIAGVTTVQGTLSTTGSGPVIDLLGGVLQGDGTVNSDINNDGGSVSPGLSPGTLNVNGDYTQTADGNLTIELTGTASGQFDVLAINGSADLAGGLTITPVDPFVPQVGDQFEIITATVAVTGQFNIVGPCDVAYQVIYNDQSVVVSILGATCIHDSNCDGQVGTDDFFALLQNWGPCPDGACPWDTAGSGGEPDGVVGTPDFFALLQNWGPCE